MDNCSENRFADRNCRDDIHSGMDSDFCSDSGRRMAYCFDKVPAGLVVNRSENFRWAAARRRSDSGMAAAEPDKASRFRREACSDRAARSAAGKRRCFRPVVYYYCQPEKKAVVQSLFPVHPAFCFPENP